MRTLSKLFLVLLLCNLAACASNGTLEYKPLHWRGKLWAITGKAIIDPDGDFITIVINDTDVMSGILSKDNPVVVMEGKYQDYDISSRCQLNISGGKNAKHICGIMVDGAFAGNFSF